MWSVEDANLAKKNNCYSRAGPFRNICAKRFEQGFEIGPGDVSTAWPFEDLAYRFDVSAFQ